MFSAQPSPVPIPTLFWSDVEPAKAIGAGRDKRAQSSSEDTSPSHDAPAPPASATASAVSGRALVEVDDQQPGALAPEGDRGGAAVADLAALGLARAGHDRRLAFEPAAHCSSCAGSTLALFRVIASISLKPALTNTACHPK